MLIQLPKGALVLLVGLSGSGKSYLAAQHFLETEILSSDLLRAWICDDANDQSATEAAFDLLHYILDLRLARGCLSVVDATNIYDFGRAILLERARAWRRPAVALILDQPLEFCVQRAEARAPRPVAREVILLQAEKLEETLKALPTEGFDQIYLIRNPEELEIVRA